MTFASRKWVFPIAPGGNTMRNSIVISIVLLFGTGDAQSRPTRGNGSSRTAVKQRRRLTLNPMKIHARVKSHRRKQFFKEKLGQWHKHRRGLKSSDLSTFYSAIEGLDRSLRPRSPLRDRLASRYSGKFDDVGTTVALSRLASTRARGFLLSRDILLRHVQRHPRVVSQAFFQDNAGRYDPATTIGDMQVVRLAYSSRYPTHANEILNAALDRVPAWDKGMRSYFQRAKFPPGQTAPDFRRSFFFDRKEPSREQVASWGSASKGPQAAPQKRHGGLVPALSFLGGYALTQHLLSGSR
jgi:hypothetical protein